MMINQKVIEDIKKNKKIDISKPLDIEYHDYYTDDIEFIDISKYINSLSKYISSELVNNFYIIYKDHKTHLCYNNDEYKIATKYSNKWFLYVKDCFGNTINVFVAGRNYKTEFIYKYLDAVENYCLEIGNKKDMDKPKSEPIIFKNEIDRQIYEAFKDYDEFCIKSYTIDNRNIKDNLMRYGYI